MPDEKPFFELPEGVTDECAHEVVVALDSLFTETAADDHNRYHAAKQVLWQTIAALMAQGLEDRLALQIVISAISELLTGAIGPAEAHLHLMADRIASLQQH